MGNHLKENMQAKEATKAVPESISIAVTEVPQQSRQNDVKITQDAGFQTSAPWEVLASAPVPIGEGKATVIAKPSTEVLGGDAALSYAIEKKDRQPPRASPTLPF